MSSPAKVNQQNTKALVFEQPPCHHCGETCPDTSISLEEYHFCCEGCKTVFEILDSNDLCNYYTIDSDAAFSLKGKRKASYAYLDEAGVIDGLIDFTDGEKTRVTFFLPQIHCSSCIWLLENLYRLNEHIFSSKVNFLKKEINLVFDPNQTSLRSVVELLDSIGYAPIINLNSLEDEARPMIDRGFFYKLGVAGFAFGNIMLLSFPEYLGLDKTTDTTFFRVFGYLNILLALPVVFYSARSYLQSAWLGLRQRKLNIDVPIALGILTLFVRSVTEILMHTGAGYLDSLAGLVFFLLIGKWFQQRTYHHLSFERDYKSYFPIAANKLNGQQEQSVSLDQLQVGDQIVVRNGEIIPADGILMKGRAKIDYSFVTGEANEIAVAEGEKVFAGGRQQGLPIQLTLTKRVAQSYLTQLWNDESFTKAEENQASEIANRVGTYFTYTILAIAFTTLAYWLNHDWAIAIESFTAVLIIACPCAVALAIPFIFGNAIQILAKHQFYLKNTSIIERLQRFTKVVFDKTGTLTSRKNQNISFIGNPLTQQELSLVLAAVRPSNHPISQQLTHWLQSQLGDADLAVIPPSTWEEQLGKGVQGTINGYKLRLGSTSWICSSSALTTGTYLEINGQVRGHFEFGSSTRPGIRRVLDDLKQRAQLYLLSGDNKREKTEMSELFGQAEGLHFQQSPKDKLQFIKQLQTDRSNVLMIGDGLNDAGALKQSDLGIVVTENTNNFTPASDAILQADQLQQLPVFLQFARGSIRLVYWAYGFAFIYNIIGLSFAVQGLLSPIVAAILMPLSSISIVVFGIASSTWLARRLGL